MRSNFIRVFTLMGLSVCTAFVTSQLIGPSRSRGGDVTTQTPQGTTRVSEGPVAIPAEAQDASGDVVLRGQVLLHPANIEVNGHDVVISTQADIVEARPRRSYLWSLEIVNQADKTVVLKEQYYQHQRFQLPVGETEMHPTFTEHVALFPGVYMAHVRLYFIEPNVKLPDFSKGEKMGGKRPVSTSGKIVVGD